MDPWQPQLETRAGDGVLKLSSRPITPPSWTFLACVLQLLGAAAARTLSTPPQKVGSRRRAEQHLPPIVVIVLALRLDDHPRRCSSLS